MLVEKQLRDERLRANATKQSCFSILVAAEGTFRRHKLKNIFLNVSSRNFRAFFIVEFILSTANRLGLFQFDNF